jgi:hypothetical protein
MRWLATIRSTCCVLFLPLFLSLAASAQSTGCRSASVHRSVSCASVIVEFADITAKRIRGKVELPSDERVIIEVFEIERSKRKDSAYNSTSGRPSIVLETNERGEFCHSGLADGDYVLRFGSDNGGWNCSWIKVRISKTSRDRKMKIHLTAGI